ncbi:hypothetical protein OCH239_09730 [Roseivivax halodurans JCM 10272]|uniref:Uncharacterized protein n=1 Tax=Roseivivax halodurans JCM 10272 TaxID=1449350 RepID=X7EBT6_9RHOB|nr:hypothetical protein [Roseivivax halodurans]ETX13549.1 hypothetical protein OCH239_09730 [Roseivivax halodurans JCM 10272]
MPAEDYPRVLRHLTERRAAQFTAIVAELEAARAAGEIANARLNDAKLPFSRAIEEAWDREAQRPYLWNRDYPGSAREREAMDAFTGSPAPHLMRSFTARAAKLGETEAGRVIRGFLEEIAPLMELMAHCKTIAVKRQVRTPEARPSEIYSAPAASGTAMAEVNAALQEITRAARDHLAEMISAREERVLEQFLAAVEENRNPPEGQRQLRNFSPYEYSRRKGRGQSRPDLRVPLEALTQDRYDRDLKLMIHEPRPDFRDILRDRGRSQADALCSDFIDRNLSKLASIVDAKGNFETIDIIGRSVNPAGMEGRLRVSFDDDSRFEARTSVVWSCSPLGTPFTRYPVTFHDVRMPGGELTRKMSQKEMNEIFAAAPAAAPDPHPGP